MPEETPVTKPVLLITDATLVEPDVQTPPEIESVKEILEPTHTGFIPEVIVGTGYALFIVIALETLQPMLV